MKRFFALPLSILLAIGTGWAVDNDRADEAVWPQWHGPNRDNLSTATGLLTPWPATGPPLLWTAAGCGKGYGSVAVTRDMICASGTSNEQTFVVAFDHAGNLKWRAPNGRPWRAAPEMKWAVSYDGARATPTVSDGAVYHLGDLGQLTAFDAVSGTNLWTLNIVERFGVTVPEYGYAESVLVDGPHVICYPGGPEGYMVALDRKTGDVVWANTDIGDRASYCSPILVEDGGLRQIITMTREAVIGVEAADGKLLWRYPHTNQRKINATTPIYRDGCVYATTGYGKGGLLLRLTYEGRSAAVTQVWANAVLDNNHGGVVQVGGFIYGAGFDRQNWICLDILTGQTRYADAGVGRGSLTFADGMLYCLGEKGTMALVPCTPERFAPVSRFEVPKGGEGFFWAHPVVCGGRLYVRHADRLYAYDVASRRRETP